MSIISYQTHKQIPLQSLLQLYLDAHWTAYTKAPEVLQQAVQNSLFVLTAWHENQLVGLLRVVGDGLTIVYIQDILVLKAYKRQKIGTILIAQTLEKFKDVRQKVLLTDDTEETRGFYESLGFESCDKGNLVAFVKL